MEATVIAPGGGELIGDAPDRRVEILCEEDALHATWSRFAAGRAGADLHIHRHHADLFYVLDGELTVRLADRELTLAVPPLVVHGFRNGSDADVRYLNFHSPGMRFASYLRSLREGDPITYDQEDPPAEGTRPPEDVYAGPADASFDGIEVSVGEPEMADASRVRGCFVLDGELVLTAGGRELRAPAGAWVTVPAGVEAEVIAPAHVVGVRAG
jgi:uncharacterized cupin superfamily protein